MDVKLRRTEGNESVRTSIWKEIPSDENPYIAKEALCYGYDFVDLVKKRDYIDVLYLLLLGELPNKSQHRLLELLSIALCNPGPRSSAGRSALVAGAGKSESSNILPISLSILSGAYMGAKEVQMSMRFIKQNLEKDPASLAVDLLADKSPGEDGNIYVSPGFGTVYGGIDLLCSELSSVVCDDESAGKALQWGKEFSGQLEEHGCGWLPPGLAAAGFLDLGLDSMSGAAVFQLVSAPGLLVHGLEMCRRKDIPIPFLSQENYILSE